MDIKCPSCDSTKIYKKGTRNTKNGIVKKYQCKLCKFNFCDSTAWDMNHTKEEISIALWIYHQNCAGFKDIQIMLKSCGINITYKTFRRWIEKYDYDFTMGEGLWKGEGILYRQYDKNEGVWKSYRKNK